MPINVNCQHYKYGGHCTHHAAPRRWFGLPQCVVMAPPADLRLRGCELIYPHTRPDGYPLPPPSTLQGIGSQQAYTLTPMIQPDKPWPRA